MHLQIETVSQGSTTEKTALSLNRFVLVSKNSLFSFWNIMHLVWFRYLRIQKFYFPELSWKGQGALKKATTTSQISPFSATRRYKRHQNKVRGKGAGTNSSYSI